MMVTFFSFIIWFILVPLIMGDLICFGPKDRIRSNPFFRYIIGFFGQISVFTVICLPVTIMEGNYHTVKELFVIFSGVIFVLYIIRKMADRKKNTEKKIQYDAFKIWIKEGKTELIGMIGFLVLMIFQVIKIYTTGGLNVDDTVYIPIANDILYSDRLMMRDYVSGAYYESIWQMHGKYIGSTWFVMIAFWADMMKVHVLFMWKTLFPMFFLLIHYLIMWMISDVFFGNAYGKRWMFLFLNGIILGVVDEKVIIGNSWGKIVVQEGCIIFLAYILYMIYQKEKTEMRDSALLLAVTVGGTGMTMMTIMLFSFKLAVMGCCQSLRKRSLFPVLQVSVAEIPVLIQAAIYVGWRFSLFRGNI